MKKYLSYLLLGIIAISGCSNTNNSSSTKNSSSVLTNNTSSSVTSSSSYVNSSSSISSNNSSNNNTTSTSGELERNYFKEEDAALLTSYFNFEVPYIDLEYILYDYTAEYNVSCLVINFLNATDDDFINYREMVANAFTFEKEYDDGSDYWYCYSKDNLNIDICYDNYSDDVPFIYVQIYDSSINDDSNNDENQGSTTVNGYFNEEDSALLASYFDFKIPCIGEEYELYDYTEYYGSTCINIYFDYINETDFDNYLSLLADAFTFENEYSDGSDYWYIYSIDNYIINVCYDDYSYDYPYIYFIIFDESLLEDDNSGENEDSNVSEFVDGYFNEEDAALLASYFDLKIPCVGEEYELYNYIEDYGCFVIYYNYVTEEQYNTLLNELNSNFIEDGSEEYEGYTYYFYLSGDAYICVTYDPDGYDYPYVYLEIGYAE